MMRRILLGFFLVCLLTLAAAAAFVWHHQRAMLTWLATPLDPGGEARLVNIEAGTSVRGALALLVREGLVADAPYVRFVGRVGPPVAGVKVGEYELSPALSPLELLDMLAQGRVKTYGFTIPEGFTVVDVARRLEATGFAAPGEVEALAKDRAFLAELGIPQFEGYLFPSTYQVAKPFDTREILRHMVATLRRSYDSDLRRKADEKGYDLNQVLIMASIVEKESGGPEEYPLVSSVIHNRLARNMRLQMDPTVIYGIANFNGNLTRRDLERDHPWNTYTRAGLPPTPICNPGIGAIRATLFPETTDYLYFVSMNNGRHVFSRTLAEHNRAVQKYQVQGHVGPPVVRGARP